MALTWCAGHGGYFDGEVGELYCTDLCKERAQRALRGESMPVSISKPVTKSVSQAWRELSDEAGHVDNYHGTIRPTAAFSAPPTSWH